MKVNFMIVGAQKSATSTLFSILERHPELVGARGKEPHFFSMNTDWRQKLDDYKKLFLQQEGVQYFEASTSYTSLPLWNLNIHQDLYEYNADLKFIYMVRNPIDRIISNYMHFYERGYTDLPINEAIIDNRFFIDMSRYASQIIPYIKQFGRDKVMIIDFDEFNKNRAETLKDISLFLQVNSAGFVDFENVHVNISTGGGKTHHKWDQPSLPYKVIRKISPRLWNKFIQHNSIRSFSEKPILGKLEKQMIINLLSLEIESLEQLMDKNLQHWKSFD